MDGGLMTYISSTCYSLKEFLYSAVRASSVSVNSSAPTLISEEIISLLPLSQPSLQVVSKSERIILEDTHNHKPGLRTRSSVKSSSSSTGSSAGSGTGSFSSSTGSGTDSSPLLHSSRRRLFGPEIKMENSLKSPPRKLSLSRKKSYEYFNNS
jgi:hypothetical protein